MLLSKLSKKKKIILSLAGIGILTTSIVTPILVLNSDKKIKTDDKLNQNEEKNKQKDDLLVDLLKGLKFKNGGTGKIFQDSFENLWVFGRGKNKSKFQVLESNKDQNGGYASKGWINDKSKGLLKNSNFIDTTHGKIFQDKFENLWVMGEDSKLEVLKANKNGNGYVNTGWNNEVNLGLTKKSNITDGSSGAIFHDDFGNLWTMGKGTKLQVLKAKPNSNDYVDTGWSEDISSGLTTGLKIKDGTGGTIFQDEFKNLWAMGKSSKLQVLKAKPDKSGYVDTGWSEDISLGLTKDSKIEEGYGGTIFQDEFKNLWAMGSFDSKLQVLKAKPNKSGYVDTGWSDNTNLGLTKDSKITDGVHGIIFQDKFKNLWSMGWESKLQVLKVNENSTGYVSSWIDDNTTNGLLKNSNVIDFKLLRTRGRNGAIFQDTFKNLWVMSSNFRLQVLKANENGTGYVSSWVNNNDPVNGDKLLKNSKINNHDFINLGLPWINGYGTIFQDKFKNLWAMGSKTKLQVLKANQDGDGYLESWES